MIETPTDEAAASALQAAVDSLNVAVEHLIKLVDDGALTDLGALGLLDTLQTLERVRNKLPVLDRARIAYGTEQGVPAALSETDHAPCPHHRTPPLGQGSVPTRQSRRTSPTWSAGTTTTDSPNAAGKYRINTDG